MEENKDYIAEIKKQIKKIKFEIIEKQEKLDELLNIVNNSNEDGTYE